MASPSISVITVCCNAERTIRRTIESVLGQTHADIEYIIIDGKSGDGTCSILEQYGQRITWISERDSGIYDAMNKGVRRARGEWIHILNADDWYVSKDALANAMAQLNPAATNYFDLIRVYPDGHTVLQGRSVSRWMLYVSAFLPHPSLIVSQEQYAKVGLYDDSLRIASDHDLILRLVASFPPRHIPFPLVAMEQAGISARMLDTTLDEFAAVTARHGMPAPLAAGIRRLKAVWWKARLHA